jgi:hypothetical protein
MCRHSCGAKRKRPDGYDQSKCHRGHETRAPFFLQFPGSSEALLLCQSTDFLFEAGEVA